MPKAIELVQKIFDERDEKERKNFLSIFLLGFISGIIVSYTSLLPLIIGFILGSLIHYDIEKLKEFYDYLKTVTLHFLKQK